MAQYTLSWDNTAVLNNPNVTGQRASYQSIGGTWQSLNFTPANDLPTSANTVDTPSTLVDNVVYQFKIEAICTVGGLVPNDNGFPQAINFACLTPVLSSTQTTGTITFNLAGISITAISLTLIRSDNGAVILNAFRVGRTSGTTSITYTQSNLITDNDGVQYYWKYSMFATIIVNGSPVEVRSDSANYLGAGVLCTPYPFSTVALPQCASVTGLHVAAKVV